MKQQPVGAQPFSHISARQALLALQGLLAAMGIGDAWLYRTHDFRRGHAEDLLQGGGRLRQILEAGDWRSGTFMTYLNRIVPAPPLFV